MRKSVVALMFLLVSLLFCGVSTAESKQNDFLLMDGITWSMSAKDLAAYFEMEPIIETNALGNMTSVGFYPVPVPGVQGKASFQFAFDEELQKMALCMMILEVDKPLVSLTGDDIMKETYEILINEGNQIYRDRAKVLFSSAEEMQDVCTATFDPSIGVYLSSFINGLKGSIEVFQGMYNTNGLECITNAKAWYIDKRLGTSVMYSGKKVNDNIVVVSYVNMEAFLNDYDSLVPMFGGQQEIDLTNSRFGFPTGCSWGDNQRRVREALGSAYLGEEMGIVYASFYEDDFTGGYETVAAYIFDDNGLAMIEYAVVDADFAVYEDIIATLIEDIGVPLSNKYGNEMKEMVLQSNMGMENVEIWLSDELISICGNVPSEKMVIVRIVPLSLLTN